MENLRVIPGFNGQYGMSFDGIVYRLASRDFSGHIRKIRPLQARIHGRGYLYVRLSLNGQRKMYSLNTLIHKTFPETSYLLGVLS